MIFRSILNIIQEKQDLQEHSIAFLKNELRLLRQQYEKDHRALGQLKASVSDNMWGLSHLKNLQEQTISDLEMMKLTQKSIIGNLTERQQSGQKVANKDDKLVWDNKDKDLHRIPNDVISQSDKKVKLTETDEHVKNAITQLNERLTQMNQSLGIDRHLLNTLSSALGFQQMSVEGETTLISNKLSPLIGSVKSEPVSEDRFEVLLKNSAEFAGLESRTVLLEETASHIDQEFQLLTNHINDLRQVVHRIKDEILEQKTATEKLNISFLNLVETTAQQLQQQQQQQQQQKLNSSSPDTVLTDRSKVEQERKMTEVLETLLRYMRNVALLAAGVKIEGIGQQISQFDDNDIKVLRKSATNRFATAIKELQKNVQHLSFAEDNFSARLKSLESFVDKADQLLLVHSQAKLNFDEDALAERMSYLNATLSDLRRATADQKTKFDNVYEDFNEKMFECRLKLRYGEDRMTQMESRIINASLDRCQKINFDVVQDNKISTLDTTLSQNAKDILSLKSHLEK